MLVAVVAIVTASSLWSVTPTRTLYQGLVLVSLLTCAWYLASVWGRAALVRLLALSLGLLSAISVVLTLAGINVSPTVRGMFEHKNILGQVAAIAAILGFVSWRGGSSRALAKLVGKTLTILSVLAVLMSGSKAALVMVVLGSAVVLAISVSRAVPRLVFLGGALALVGLAIAVRQYLPSTDEILGGLDRSSDLSGRSEIWDLAWAHARERPLSGWGYLSFWGEQSWRATPNGNTILGAGSAHNGYLEMALGAGLIAAAWLIVTTAHLVLKALREASRNRAGSAAALAISITFAAHNLVEVIIPGSVQTLPIVVLAALTATSQGRSP